MTIRTVVTKIKCIKEGNITNIRRNGALETHIGEDQGSNSLSFAATRDFDLIVEAFSFSPVTP